MVRGPTRAATRLTSDRLTVSTGTETLPRGGLGLVSPGRWGGAERDSGGDLRWRPITERQAALAESPVSYGPREAVDEAIEDICPSAPSGSINMIDDPTVEFVERDGGWIWRLIDETGSRIAGSLQRPATRQGASDEMLVFKQHAPDDDPVVTW